MRYATNKPAIANGIDIFSTLLKVTQLLSKRPISIQDIVTGPSGGQGVPHILFLQPFS